MKTSKYDTFVWPRDRMRVREVQAELRDKTVIIPLEKMPSLVAGVDSAFLDDSIISVACLYKYPELTLVEEKHVVKKLRFPYIPGFLSFREGPAAIEAIEKLSIRPDCVIFDGQGIAHPKRIGVASYAGVLLDMPVIGCAKSRLVGEYKEPGKRRGAWSPLKVDGDTVGAVLRTRTGVKPLFISPGNKIDISGSIEIILGCTVKYRLPEPIRRADALSKRLKKSMIENA